jgi:exodeoxyribonuclease VII large subunit
MLVRGGGSRDDLDPFDQEEVARAIRACPYPVVVGVGHQVDTTIADLAADLSTPTPSGAAERVFPDRRELARRLGGMLKLGSSHLKRQITASGARLDSLGSRLKRPLEEAFSREDFRLRSLRSSAASALRLSLERGYGQLRDLSGALEALSPLGVLKRGYAEIQHMDGRKIPCAADLVPGQRVTILFQDGSRPARILGD